MRQEVLDDGRETSLSPARNKLRSNPTVTKDFEKRSSAKQEVESAVIKNGVFIQQHALKATTR